MFKTLSLIKEARALTQHSGARMGAISRNIAHANTPGYQAVDVGSFKEAYADSARAVDMRVTHDAHITSTQNPFRASVIQDTAVHNPNGNSVSLETEMVKSAEAQQNYDMALAVYQSASSILRTSLGRGAGGS